MIFVGIALAAVAIAWMVAEALTPPVGGIGQRPLEVDL